MRVGSHYEASVFCVLARKPITPIFYGVIGLVLTIERSVKRDFHDDVGANRWQDEHDESVDGSLLPFKNIGPDQDDLPIDVKCMKNSTERTPKRHDNDSTNKKRDSDRHDVSFHEGWFSL
nr:MAG TPA: hypothetical protein [Caudoviricetes sp.]DAY44716.1 MAG TPA: hypothetical protein [Caudoviricetes sp.]